MKAFTTAFFCHRKTNIERHLQMPPPSPMSVVSVSIDFPSNSQRDAPFHDIAYNYFRADWDGLRDHFRNVPWEDIFKLGASAAASELCEFSASCTAAIAHRNHFFRLYQKDKFRKDSNRCKRVLEAAKLAYTKKTK